MSALAPIQRLGSFTLTFLRSLAQVFSLLYGAAAVLAYTRTRGLRVVFEVTVSQTFFTGVQALRVVGVAALALGTLIISQTSDALSGFVDAAAFSTHALTRDVIPMMVAIIVIGRSGTAITVKLAGMKLSGEIDALRGMGLALEHFVVLPRLVAGVVSTIVLNVYGLAVALGGGYALSKSIGSLPFTLDALVGSIDEHDVIETLSKAALFGACIVLVSIREGYTVQASTREVPQATTRSVVSALSMVLVLNTLISISF